MSKALTPSDLAPGLLLGEGVRVGAEAQIGANVVIHAGTTIGQRCVIGDGAVLGKAPTLWAGSTAPREPSEPARLEDDSAVLAGAIVFAGATLGASAIAGDQSHIRERSTIGAGSVIGRGSAIDNDVRIGERVRVQTDCYITAYTVIEDDVFVGPGVTTANDHTMDRLDHAKALPAPVLRRACRVGAGAVICPGIEIGEEAFVAAGAVVAADVSPRSVVMGVPARHVREAPPEDLLERWR